MENQFESLDLELIDLKPAVKERALEILKGMSEEIKSDPKAALSKAIAEAESWFVDSEG